jgi:hypothetical protein
MTAREELRTVIFIDEDEQECIEYDRYYFVIDEIEVDMLIVAESKFSRFKAVEGTPDELFYAEYG